MVEVISLTPIYARRIKEMKNIGIKNKSFKTNSFDFTRTFSNLMENKKSIIDETKGYNRLLENEKFVNRHKKDLN